MLAQHKKAVLMEKYSQDDQGLRDNLINEEAQLMQQVQRYMGLIEKTASEETQYQHIHNRLQHVRQKITDIDLGKKN